MCSLWFVEDKLMSKIKYGDLYSKDFLDNFKNSDARNKIVNLEVDEDNLFIDVDKIIECLGLREKNTIIFDKSGQYNPDKKEILINITDPIQRQRFTKAHEIGHAVLHKEFSNREEYTTVFDLKEREANQFAAELLMPKKLIIEGMRKYKLQYKIKNWNDIDIDHFIKYLSNELKVSWMSMKYRLINLGLIV